MATQASQILRVGPLLADHRRAMRRSVEMTRAGLSMSDDSRQAVSLVDVSTFGCRLSGAEDIAVGDRVRLTLGGAAVGATVMWCGDEMIGCRFDVPIARPLMRSLVLGTA